MKNCREIVWLLIFSLPVCMKPAFGLDLDWKGVFRAESHYVSNYALSGRHSSRDTLREAAEGYYVPWGGRNVARFQTLFLRLDPKVIVNDNIFVQSQIDVGDPSFGFFGDSTTAGMSSRHFGTTQTGRSTIMAQRFWATVQTDLAAFDIGRAPLHWGLGLHWSEGKNPFDRFPSTGDMLRMRAKFGAFSFEPAFIKYSLGNSISGICEIGSNTSGDCKTYDGAGSLVDYSIAAKYQNLEEDFDAGVNFVLRSSGDREDPISGYINGTGSPGRFEYITWLLYLRKRLGALELATEIPITSGDLGGGSSSETIRYGAFSVATETRWTIDDVWLTTLKAGRVPGQENMSGLKADKFTGYAFHPDYRLALIMFNYQLANFAGPSSSNNRNVTEEHLANPFDNPITNANYLAWGLTPTVGKWTFKSQLSAAWANITAQEGKYFYNSWKRGFAGNPAAKNQESFMGWEWDLGVGLQWEEQSRFDFDFGLWRPGKYYRFSNLLADNSISPVFAAALKFSVQF